MNATAYKLETEFFTAERDVRVRGKAALKVLEICQAYIRPADLPMMINHDREICFLPAVLFERVAFDAGFASAVAGHRSGEALAASAFIIAAAAKKLDAHLIFQTYPSAEIPSAANIDTGED